MKNIITSVGRTVFKSRSILSVRAPGLESGQPKNIGLERQNPKNTGLDTGVMGQQPAQGARFTHQQNSEAPRSWEDEKARMGLNADKHEMPWVAQAKKQVRTDFGDKSQNFGAKSKLSQATDFVKNQSNENGQTISDMAEESVSKIKEQASELKNQAADTLNQAAEFVKKQASVAPTDFQENKADSQGFFGNIKETASHAVDWVKEKISGEHTEQKIGSTETFKADKDRLAENGIKPEQTISEKSLKEQAQPKVNKETKEEIGKIIEKGVPKN